MGRASLVSDARRLRISDGAAEVQVMGRKTDHHRRRRCGRRPPEDQAVPVDHRRRTQCGFQRRRHAGRVRPARRPLADGARRLHGCCPPDGHGDRGRPRMGAARENSRRNTHPPRQKNDLQRCAQQLPPPPGPMAQAGKADYQPTGIRRSSRRPAQSGTRSFTAGSASPSPTAAVPNVPSTRAGGYTTRSRPNPTEPSCATRA